MMASVCVEVDDLFAVDQAAKQATCKMCNKIITDLRKYSYFRHYKLMHKARAVQLGILEEDDDQAPEKKVPKIEIRMSQQILSKSLIELLTKHGLPMNLLQYPAFQSIIRPIEEGLKMKHVDVAGMHNVLRNVAGQIKTVIAESLKGKLICLKVDTATRMDREFLGVNVQYPDNKVIQVRTLDVLELHDRHTAEYLADQIQNVLAPFGITLQHLLCVTTDNASNMIATVNRLKKFQDLFLIEEQDQIDADGNSSLLEENDSASDDDDDPNDEAGTSAEDEEAISKRCEFSSERFNAVEGILQGIRCAEHTLQLAVTDTVKQKDIKDMISRIRVAVKVLRKQPYRKMFKLSNRRRPKLDCPTRWSSTFKMMKSLSTEKEFIITLTDKEEKPIIADEEWNFIEKFTTIFTPIDNATVKLQSNQMTFGDMFLLWEKCSFTLKNIEDDLATLLLSNMNKRRQVLMTNRVFLAAIFVDQRINFKNSPFMTNEEREVAMVSENCFLSH